MSCCDAARAAAKRHPGTEFLCETCASHWTFRAPDQAMIAAYERGLREGREAERADVVAWLDAHNWLEAAEDLERAEHVPTPQGDHAVSSADFRADPARYIHESAEHPVRVVGEDGATRMTLSGPRVEEPEEWGWYIEGGRLLSGFSTRAEAVRHAVVEYEAESFHVGRMIAIDVAQWVSAESVAESVAETIWDSVGLEEIDVSISDEAERALEAWAREHLTPEPARYCDGERVTPEEIAAAKASASQGDEAQSRSQARRLAAQRGELVPDFSKKENDYG